MYARSYYPETPERMNIPENYDGTAFSEREESNSQVQDSLQAGSHIQNEKSVEAGLGRIPILSSLFGKGSHFSPFSFKLSDIGTEEILIIAAAAFLFFSKEGDKESAIILLLLLFIR